MNLVLDQTGALAVDGRATTPADARAVLQAAVAHNPGAQAVIAADRTVPYGKVMEVIDLVKGAGVGGFALDVGRADAPPCGPRPLRAPRVRPCAWCGLPGALRADPAYPFGAPAAIFVARGADL